MADVEKVIKGLECWLIDAPGCPDEYCPYMGGMALCNEKAILKDAVELLKEQREIIEKYKKADGFLAVHGWKWDDVK